MPKIVWDAVGEHLYETGVDRGVLFVCDDTGAYGNGVAWNGLVSVSESPEGAEANPFYADNIKYLNLISIEEFKASLEAYTYPKEFEVCDGSAELAPGITIGQQNRKTFGLAYRTLLGNDVAGNSYGYKIHLIYGAVAAPSEKAYTSINDSPEPITLSWELSTTPVPVTGHNPTASLVIDSTAVGEGVMAQIEDLLYGTASEEATLPMPDEILALIAQQ